MEAASGTSTCEKEHLACEYSDVTVDSPLDDLAGAVKMVPDVVKQVRAQKKTSFNSDSKKPERCGLSLYRRVEFCASMVWIATLQVLLAFGDAIFSQGAW